MRSIALLLFIIVQFASAQTYDTIDLRSVFVNDFCLGDSVSFLYDVFGAPSNVEFNVVDEAIENTLPAQNIFYYNENCLSEPYLISKNRIGGFKIIADTCFALKIIVDEDTLSFKLKDRLDNVHLTTLFPYSMNFSNSIFNEIDEYNRDAYVVLKLKEQSNYFEYPYPLIHSLTLSYSDSLLETIQTDYYKE